MEFFDFIKAVFSKTEFSDITPGEKRKHFFLSNRRYAIQFPLQANMLQHLKINQSAVMDYWNFLLSNQYKYIPGWLYTKGVKKTTEVKEKKMPISSDTIKEYCKHMQIDPKSVRDALIFFPNDMIDELKKFENIIKQ